MEQWESWCWRIEAVSERDELGDRWRKVERGNGRNQSCFLRAPLCLFPLHFPLPSISPKSFSSFLFLLSFLLLFLHLLRFLIFVPRPPPAPFLTYKLFDKKNPTKDSALNFETFWNRLLGSNRTLSWNQTISSGCAPEAVGSCWWRVLCLFLPLLLFHLTDSLHPEILRENASLVLLLLDFGYAGFLLPSDVILKSSTGVVPFCFFSHGGRGPCVLWSEVLVFHRFFVDLVFLREVVVELSYLCFMPIFLDSDLFFGRAASLSSCTVADCSSWFVGCCWLSAVLSQLMLAVKGNTNVN